MNKAELKSRIHVGLSSESEVRCVVDSIINDLLSSENDVAYITATLQQYLRYMVELDSERNACAKELSQKQVAQMVAESDEEFEKRKAYEQHKVMVFKNSIADSLDVLDFAKDYLTLQIQQVGSVVEKRKVEQESEDIKKVKAEVEGLKEIVSSKFEVGKKVLSREQVCQHLNIKNRKLTSLIGSGKVQPVDYAAKPYTFHRAELDRYIENRPREEFLTTPKPTKKKNK